jgi:beta-glucuronidase
VLRFESATHRATVWVGEREVVSHEGGYTPFEAEITPDVRAGELIKITTLAVELYGPRRTLLDRYDQRFGIGSVEVRGAELLINGRPFDFKGFGMHEDHLVRGKGHDAAEMVQDFELLAWTGANSFRTSHYPYSEDVMDYADAHGVVVIDEAPAVGMNAAVAQVLGTPIEKLFSRETVNALTREVHAQAIRELIARDKNRPSVVLWSIANEPESHTDEAVEYFEPLFALARALDASRPVGFVNQMHAPCKLARFSDVLMINRYYGWYRSSGDLVQAEIDLERERGLSDIVRLRSRFGA